MCLYTMSLCYEKRENGGGVELSCKTEQNPLSPGLLSMLSLLVAIS